ncbi:dihydrofolate reductase family protein [Pelagicoccus enzymogenes]|uniref:dihydrofolate reductase family protein n=1 Tax=Pelagicoccus enzymogenes TaxID=2773457 RepID=UPI00280EED71|nr:dihydrofolate reductase family protein [Pelagicoccus enzymogenes]MDQ8200513.1 dihydrofolate reductase family protein [Pelagicoccus enzymogenes]
MANLVYIATSLDGYIATKEGGIEWLTNIPNPSGSDFGYADFIARVDAILMGRNTFEKVLSFGGWHYEKPVFVLSKSLTELPQRLEGKAELISGSPDKIQATLSRRGLENIYIDGGMVVQSFLQADLIDELIITTIPKLLGDGIPLFGKLERMKAFTHLSTEVINDCLVKSRYLRKKDASHETG